jgi:hypothetical protein
VTVYPYRVRCLSDTSRIHRAYIAQEGTCTAVYDLIAAITATVQIGKVGKLRRTVYVDEGPPIRDVYAKRILSIVFLCPCRPITCASIKGLHSTTRFCHGRIRGRRMGSRHRVDCGDS